MNEKFRAAGLPARLATALFLIALLIIVWQLGGGCLTVFVALVSIVGLWEFFSLFKAWNTWIMRILGVLLGSFYIGTCAFRPQYPPLTTLMVCSLILATYALFAWSREKTPESLCRAAFILSGIIYIPVLLSPVIHFSRWEQLLVVVVPAVSDMAAYFTGVCFGKHRIWPTVSPKKSLEGAAGGLAAAIAATCVLGFFTGKAPLPFFVILGTVMGVMAQMGDFFESALKRAANVKDSSHILPGHGGVLDRIDSILFCSGTYAMASGLYVFF